MRYLHVNDNSLDSPHNSANHDPLFKVRPVFDLINNKIKSIYTPSGFLTVDEGMVPFRGRLSFRVYMKNKPNKYGIRIEMVCDATNGVVVHMEVYTGAASQTPNDVHSLVTRLLTPFEGKNYRVYMDRRYSSPTLFEDLLSKGFYPVGTVMSNRRNLPKVFKAKLQVGQVITRRKAQLMALKWRDRRDVLMLSSVSRNEMVATGTAHQSRHQRVKPAAVIDYNNHKAGVDRLDQMASYYPLHRKTVKW
jgi:hypothetical protein